MATEYIRIAYIENTPRGLLEVRTNLPRLTSVKIDSSKSRGAPDGGIKPFVVEYVSFDAENHRVTVGLDTTTTTTSALSLCKGDITCKYASTGNYHRQEGGRIQTSTADFTMDLRSDASSYLRIEAIQSNKLIGLTIIDLPMKDYWRGPIGRHVDCTKDMYGGNRNSKGVEGHDVPLWLSVQDGSSKCGNWPGDSIKDGSEGSKYLLMDNTRHYYKPYVYDKSPDDYGTEFDHTDWILGWSVPQIEGSQAHTERAHTLIEWLSMRKGSPIFHPYYQPIYPGRTTEGWGSVAEADKQVCDGLAKEHSPGYTMEYFLMTYYGDVEVRWWGFRRGYWLDVVESYTVVEMMTRLKDLSGC